MRGWSAVSNCILILGLGALLLYSGRAEASDPCKVFANYVPLPPWYRAYCSEAGGLRAKLGGGFSSIADSMNTNPAALPTLPLPLGFEYITSTRLGSGEYQNNFALIKGFNRVGAGISTNSVDTFYSGTRGGGTRQAASSNIVTGATSTDALTPSFNFGTALALLQETDRTSILPKLGAMVQYDKYTDTFSPGTGFSLASRHLNFGFSLVGETATATLPASILYTLTFGVKFGLFQAEYVYLRDTIVYAEAPVHIGTLSANVLGFGLTGAVRATSDPYQDSPAEFHFSIFRQLGAHIALSYLYNYVPGTQSLGVQVMF